MRTLLLAGSFLFACLGTVDTASAGWPFHHHHHYRYHSYAPAGSSSTFSGASSEYYVVRPSAERVRYYALSESAFVDGGLFTSSKSVEERVRAEMERAEAAKVLQQEAIKVAVREAFESAGRPGAERSSVLPGGAPPVVGAPPANGAPEPNGIPSTDQIQAQAQKLYNWRKTRMEQLEKELAILKGIQITIQGEAPAPSLPMPTP